MTTRLAGHRFNSSIDDREAERIWNVLKEAIGEIFDSNEGELSFEELYRNAYTLVLHKYGAMLYDGLEGEIREHLGKVAHELTLLEDGLFLREVVIKWMYFMVRMNMIKDVLMYMDRNYVPHVGCSTVLELGLRLFHEEIVEHTQIGPKIIDLILKAIKRERQGENADSEVLRKVLNMLIEVGVNSRLVYQKRFEDTFLMETRAFYSEESGENIKKCTTADYLIKTETRIREEESRCRTYLDPSTEKALMKVLDEELISAHASSFVQDKSGCKYMFENAMFKDLSRMYRLLGRVDGGLEEARNELVSYVRSDGEQLVEAHPDDKKALKFVRVLLEKRDHYERIVKESFKNSPLFTKGLKDGFEYVVNLKRDISQFVTLFADSIMKSKAKGKGEYDSVEKLEHTFDKILTVFRHLHEKDVFEDYYKQLLAKRLLGKKKNFSNEIAFEAEKIMISKLKAEIGPEFTNKLENMLRDIGNSVQECNEFRNQVGRREELSDSFEATILTTGSWPYQREEMCNIPENLKVRLLEKFEEFYLERHEGRRLDWLMSQGHAEIKSMFGPPGDRKEYTLVVTSYQMMILQLFNDRAELTFIEVAKLTNIPEDELRRHIVSLAAPKCRILIKEPKGRHVADEDRFSVNENFTSSINRIRVPLVSAKSHLRKEEKIDEELSANVREDRKHLTDAAIVRTMKTRKSLQHNLLIAETIRQLQQRFRPSPADIKSRIESLIERDFMERDEQDHRLYLYVAY